MPRDPSGNYSLYTPGNPVVTNTTIASSWWNNTGTDLATALTDSLSRTGLGGMLAAFKLVDGTVSAPAFSFQNESNTGFYRAGAGDVRWAIGGADLIKWTSAGFVGLAPNGHGITTTGTGTGNGVQALGGTSTSAGVAGVAGTSAGYGLYGAGVSGGLGLIALSSAGNVDAARVDGYVDLSHADNPAATTGFTNRVTPKNIAKAFISMGTNGSGSFTVNDAFNVTTGSIALGLLDITIPFAASMGNTNYTVVGTAYTGQVKAFLVQTKNTNNVHIRVFNFSDLGTPLNPATNSFGLDLVVYGAQ